MNETAHMTTVGQKFVFGTAILLVLYVTFGRIFGGWPDNEWYQISQLIAVGILLIGTIVTAGIFCVQQKCHPDHDVSRGGEVHD